MKRLFNKEAARYIVVGLANTMITYLFYLLFLFFFSYTKSYLISYILGILVSFVLNSKMVFKTKMTFMKLIQYPIVYVTQFLFGLFLLDILVNSLNINVKIAPLVVTIISIPITFAITKFILTVRFLDIFTSLINKYRQ